MSNVKCQMSNVIGIIFITFIFCTLSIISLAGEQKKLPYKTIEEAVRASGGIYSKIRSSKGADNFVKTVIRDKQIKCNSMEIREDLEISCALSNNINAHYNYIGKKGEQIGFIVTAQNFVPAVKIFDANGKVDFYLNEKKLKHLRINKTLSYSGTYQFQIYDSGMNFSNEGQPFTVMLLSDKSNLIPDIRKDSLVENKKYSINNLLINNQSTNNRTFLVKAYLLTIHKDRPCSRFVISCKISLAGLS